MGMKAQASSLVGAGGNKGGDDECKIDGTGRRKKRKGGGKGEVGSFIQATKRAKLCQTTI